MGVCKGCTERKVYCHSECERYKKEVECNEKARATRNKIKSSIYYSRTAERALRRKQLGQ